MGRPWTEIRESDAASGPEGCAAPAANELSACSAARGAAPQALRSAVAAQGDPPNETPETQARQIQRLSALGVLTASAAHDLNNAMTALRAHLYVAQIQLGQLQTLAECQTILDRCSSLTSWLLSLSSSTGGQRTNVWSGPAADLRDCVCDALTFLRHSLPSNVRVEADLGEQPAFVRIDPELMSHAVLNLLLNARDALPEGGAIVTRILVTSRDQYQLTIEDGGAGMDEETLRRSVEPLFTTKEPGRGTGLGLPSVLRVVQAAGGSVDLASQVGAGTRVTVTLPRAPAHSL